MAQQPDFPILPMKAVAGDPPRGDGWRYELKWDGMRIIAHVSESSVTLQSSNGRDVTASFPELAPLAALAEGFEALVLDGEVVAFDGDRPSFGAVQRRMHVSDPAEAARRAIEQPVLFMVFDLLWLDTHDTTSLPLHDRRGLLEQVVTAGPNWQLCEHHRDGLDALLDVVISADLEGIVAKRSDSVYEVGRRASSWVKVKPRKRQEFVVGGWISGRGTRAGGIGSLLVGAYDDSGVLHYAGAAGSGLTDTSIGEWRTRLVDATGCPFASPPKIALDGRTVQWCEPTEIVEIAFGEWGAGGQLRHPVVLGHRSDKAPHEVIFER